jgi:hypothetical protein
VPALGGLEMNGSDPSKDQWNPTEAMRAPRGTATLLPGGNVLVVGRRSGRVTAASHNPDPSRRNVGRTSQSARLLKDGLVLAEGGVDSDALIVDPSRGIRAEPSSNRPAWFGFRIFLRK